jgi:hypothetical protein
MDEEREPVETVESTAYSPTQRRLAFFFLFLGMFGPGLGLAINPNYWTTTAILVQTLHMAPFLVLVCGVILVIAALMSIWGPARDVCYYAAAIFYGVVALAYWIALIRGIHVGALFSTLPLLCWVYVRWAVNVTKWREDEVLREDLKEISRPR